MPAAPKVATRMVAGVRVVTRRLAGERLLGQLWLRGGRYQGAPGAAELAQRARCVAQQGRAAAIAGASLRGWVTPEHTVFEVVCPVEELQPCLELLRALRDAPLPLRAVAEARRRGRRPPEAGAAAALQGAMASAFPDDAWGKVSAPEPADQDVVSFHRSYSAALVVLLGDRPRATFDAALARVFDGKGVAAPVSPPALKGFAGPAIAAKAMVRGGQVPVALVLAASKEADPRALEVLARVLDQGILPGLRGEQGWRDVRAAAYAGLQRRLLLLWGQASPKGLQARVGRLLGAVFSARALAPGQLRRGLRWRRVARAMARVEPAARARLLAGDVEFGLGGEVDVSAVAALAKKLFRPEQLALFVGRRMSESSLDRSVRRAHGLLETALARRSGLVTLDGGAKVYLDLLPSAGLVAVELRWQGAGYQSETTQSGGVTSLLAAGLRTCLRSTGVARRVTAGAEDLSVGLLGLPGSGPLLLEAALRCVRELPGLGLAEARKQLVAAGRPTLAGGHAQRFASLIYHRAGRRGLGIPTAAGLAASRATLKAHARSLLRGSRLVVVASGPISVAPLLATATRHLPRGAGRGTSGVSLPLSASPAERAEPSASQTRVSVGVGLEELEPRASLAITCAADYLRAKPSVSGLAGSLSVELDVGSAWGHLSVSFVAAPAAADAALARVRHRLVTLAERLPERWIERWRQARRQQLQSRRGDTAWRARRVARQLARGWSARAEASALRALEVARLRAALRKLLSTRKLVIAITRGGAGESPALR